MLKLKDNVDLKELEKFGFEGLTRNEYYRNNKDNTFNIVDMKGVITEFQGEMLLFNMFNGFKEIVLKEEHINDLIQAGLVEKVED